jgi:DinB superfamily
MAIDNWNEQLGDQLGWHWQHHLRPRLEGITDEEYFWEPVGGCWSVRPAGTGVPGAPGSGEFRIDFVHPEPKPPPFTTVAWRLGHLITVFGERNANHFGGPPIFPQTHRYAGTAREALDQLDAGYELWRTSVAALGEEGLVRPCGPAEGPFADFPLAALILHINREIIHHGAEVLVVRDLYAHRES